ncbi:MAG TPA: YdeI/OmpD-associated family protein [Candidatus Dormibacteraeota bacterium]|nr:YdeI/OmpD-associated family protein [Candidatus Dormibacteraeota bacterium]
MPTPGNVIFFATTAELRAWFEANHETASELWLGYHRKRTGRPSVTWQEVVDQELCFGWIDSVRYSLGDDRSAQRITPRRKGSVWSAINIKRFQELDAMGLVHLSGRAAFQRRDEARSRMYSYESRSRGFDAATEAAFRKHARAWRFFEAQAPSYRRTAAFWVMSAKRAETRKRRLERLIESSKTGERLATFESPSRRRARQPGR